MGPATGSVRGDAASERGECRGDDQSITLERRKRMPQKEDPIAPTGKEIRLTEYAACAG